MKIEHTNSPEAKDIDFLHKKINEEMMDNGAANSFGFFIRNTQSKIIADCNGFMFNGDFNAIYTDQLWVHPSERNKGLAKKLMEEVHQYGRANGCNMATICTMSFQKALNLYEKLGYKVDLERKDNVNGTSCLCLRKDL